MARNHLKAVEKAQSKPVLGSQGLRTLINVSALAVFASAFLFKFLFLSSRKENPVVTKDLSQLKQQNRRKTTRHLRRI